MDLLHMILLLSLIPEIFGKLNIPLTGTNLGLRPSADLHGHNPSQTMKPALYIMQLYQTLITGNDGNLPILERSIIWESDPVLSLIPKSCSKKDNGMKLTFDMTSISSSTQLRLAELRIPSSSFKNAKLEIYHAIGGQRGVFIGSLNHLSSHNWESSSKVFNVTKMLQNYFHHAEKNNIQEDTKDVPERGDESSCMGETAKRVRLLVFAKDNSSPDDDGSPSLIKTVETSKYTRSVNEVSRKAVSRRRTRNAHNPSTPVGDGKTLCRRVDMFVDFEKIGWGNQIISPKRYNAYRCEGACPLPLNDSFKPTNHAYVQSLAHLNAPHTVSCPSCLPVKLSPMSMLQIEGGRIVLHKHEDMVVEECGCR
ncbi:nodal homolog 2-A-like [Spea bombifrons]|uniref:nodal homolog 2-A-like n=1 Tax=Spea bombifrons TaxID=233779 RepID=UPI00234A7F17|nr:nodal homolog 2-A-like [Spea bombifrons]